MIAWRRETSNAAVADIAHRPDDGLPDHGTTSTA